VKDWPDLFSDYLSPPFSKKNLLAYASLNSKLEPYDSDWHVFYFLLIFSDESIAKFC